MVNERSRRGRIRCVSPATLDRRNVHAPRRIARANPEGHLSGAGRGPGSQGGRGGIAPGGRGTLRGQQGAGRVHRAGRTRQAVAAAVLTVPTEEPTARRETGRAALCGAARRSGALSTTGPGSGKAL